MSAASAAHGRKRAAEQRKAREHHAHAKHPSSTLGMPELNTRWCECDRDYDNGEGRGEKCGRAIRLR